MLTFGRHSSAELLGVFNDKVGRFMDDPLNTDLANQCAIDAWSLCDWVFKEHGAKLGFLELKYFQEEQKNRCQYFSLIQDVANASKHKEITKYIPRLKSAQEYDGAFQRDAFQTEAFDTPALVLVDINGNEVRFENAIAEVVTHWNKYFSDNKL